MLSSILFAISLSQPPDFHIPLKPPYTVGPRRGDVLPRRPRASAKPVAPVVVEAPKPKPYTVEAIPASIPQSCRRDTRASCSNSSTRTTAEPTSRPFSPAYTSNRIGSAILSAGRFSRRRSSASRLHDGRECRWLFRLGTKRRLHPAHGMPSGTLWNASWLDGRSVSPVEQPFLDRLLDVERLFRSRFPNAMRHEAQPPTVNLTATPEPQSPFVAASSPM